MQSGKKTVFSWVIEEKDRLLNCTETHGGQGVVKFHHTLQTNGPHHASQRVSDDAHSFVFHGHPEHREHSADHILPLSTTTLVPNRLRQTT